MSSALEDEFQSAADYVAGAVTSGTAAFSDEVKLRFYGLYKQATVGQCNTSKPGFWDLSGRAKWDAWHKLGSLGQQEAMQAYMDTLRQLVPTWQGAAAAGTSDDLEGGGGESGAASSTAGGDGGAGGARKGWGPVFSAFAQEEDGEEKDGDGAQARTGAPSLHELVGAGDEAGVIAALSSGADVNARNQEGATALHFAADRGHAAMARALIAAGAELNAQDTDGCTPLHYAALCGHEELAWILIEEGADVRIENTDNETARAIAPEGWTCWH